MRRSTCPVSAVNQPVITVDGKQTKGRLHKARDGRVVFFTRNDADRPETYDLVFTDGGNAYVMSCGTWTAPHLPVFPVGDVNHRASSRDRLGTT